MPLQRLPAWIQLGAFFLAFNAGMINVLGLITVLHQSVSHMTGNVSMLGMALLAGHIDQVIYLAIVIVCFLIGSLISGLILGNSHFYLGLRYGYPLSLVAFFIVLCWLLLPYVPQYALLFACVAMGIQNAMVSHYKGAIIRTTHLSGVLTDLGLAFGYRLRGLVLDTKRVILHVLILLGFLLGGILASWIYPSLKLNAFLIPAVLSLIMSLVYWVIYLRYRHLHS
ncbi:hypothetical protein A3K93_06080 [Acinetobacter sp. NCu2D-2]|uniref:YoaK family protein n=1 Tax=Acinetobacter sp. NCu2D-2 TaxID=1608473 RepID=UPI0007CDADB2|nr:YoaK family protein [Acinetobacter sp. NCu2D-2]ANF81798.1 hypothetical protein A3K93_06080 [Acinetobacter sp. NCu2D-2]